MEYKSKKGFTLVEIMIVVVLIGLLATLAVPTFQKVRNNSVKSRMDSDARQIAWASQQYFLEENAGEVTFNYDPADGTITGGIEPYTNSLARGYGIENGIAASAGDPDSAHEVTLELVGNKYFSVQHPLLEASRTYNREGQYQENPSE